jgi:Protein of unknown function (DUF3549)
VNNINTLSEFLLQAGTQYRVFDMGRRVQKISTDVFFDFENAKVPYPYPLQQHAFIAVLFWNKNESDTHYVWFLKLPLDEQGLLVQAARSQFLELVVTALGKSMEQQPNKEQQSALDHNPLIFKPSEQKLAAFTSQSRLAMKLPASQYMAPALDYFNDDTNLAQWQALGFQGIADIATRLEQGNNLAVLCHAIRKLPNQPFCALCCCFENIAIPTKLAELLLEILTRALNDNDSVIAIHALRALSHSKGPGFQQSALEKALASELIKSQLDVVVVIAARYWQVLNSTAAAVSYLEAVVGVTPDQDIFNQLFGDLVTIPLTRTHFLNALRYPTRSEKLAKAIANLIGG